MNVNFAIACTVNLLFNSDNELQKTCDIYKKRLEDRKKAFKETLNSTAAKVKAFTGKHKMSEDEAYLKELQQIGKDIEDFIEEVCLQHKIKNSTKYK